MDVLRHFSMPYYIYDVRDFLPVSPSHPALLPPPGGHNLIQRLPVELLLQILSHLRLSDKKQLVQASRHFRAVVRGDLLFAVRFEDNINHLYHYSSYPKPQSTLPRQPVSPAVSLAITVNGRILRYGDGTVAHTTAAMHWPRLRHVQLDMTKIDGLTLVNLAPRFNAELFRNLRSLALVMPPMRANSDMLLVIVKSCPNITGLSISMKCLPRQSSVAVFASRYLSLTTLHIKRSNLECVDAGHIADMFPKLKTMILQGSIHVFGMSDQFNENLVKAVGKLPFLETLVFNLPGRVYQQSVIIELLETSKSLVRVVAVRHPHRNREYETHLVTVTRDRSDGRILSCVDQALSHPSIAALVSVGLYDIYLREFKCAVGAWPEGPVQSRF